MEEKILSLILDKLESKDKKIDSMGSRLDSMESKFNSRFTAIEKRLDSIESRLDSLESRVQKVEIDLENRVYPMFDEEREVYKSTFERYLSNNKEMVDFLQADLPAMRIAIARNSLDIAKLKAASGN